MGAASDASPQAGRSSRAFDHVLCSRAVMVYALLAVVVVVVVVVALSRKKPSAGLGPSRFPPGTRAFEAELSLPLIARLVEARELALASADPAERDTLTRQIENLRAQAAIHQATIDAEDVSPGKMSIGANPDSPTVD